MRADVKAMTKAVLAHLNDRLPDVVPAVDLTDAVGQTSNHVQVGVSRRYGGGARQTSRVGRVGWRISTRVMGHTDDDARNTERLVTLALEDALLVVGSGDAAQTSTPIHFESGDIVGEDGSDWYSGLSTWTTVL